MLTKFVLYAVIVAALGGCAIAPTHPSLKTAALPELIAVRDLVADRESTGGYSVSPDGKKLAWLGTDGVSSALWVKSIAMEDAKAFHTRVRYYRWSADSKYLAIVADNGGDENAHIYKGQVEGRSTALTNVTPFEKTNSHVLRVVDGGTDMVITSNRRDKKMFDIYKLNLATGKLDTMATNPGNVGYWGVDRAGRLRARVVIEGDKSLLQVPDSRGAASWKTTAGLHHAQLPAG